MADGYDGSIKFNTELDNDGFDKGSDKLLNAIKSLQQSVETLGQNMSTGINGVIQSLQAMSTQATNANQAVGTSGQEALQTIQQITQAANTAAQATQNMANAPRNANTEYNSINRTITSLGDRLMRLGTQARIGFSNDGQVMRFQDNMEIAGRRVEELRARLNALGEVQIPTEEYTTYLQLIDEAQQSVNELQATQDRLDAANVSQQSEAYRQIEEAIASATSRLENYQQRVSELETNGQAFTLGVDTAEYQQTAAALQNIEQQFNQVSATGERAAYAVGGFARQHPVLSALGTAAQKTGSALLTMGKAIGNAAIHAFTGAVSRLGRGLHTVAQKAKGAISGLLGFNRAAKGGINPVNSLIRGLTSFRTLLAQRIKNAIMSEVYKSFQEGIQQFALYSDAFNQAMSNIKNTGAQIGAQVAALVANIIAYIEPVLTRILALINSVITALSALFAKFSGKSTVSVAAKGTQSYADSLKNAAGGASKAAKEQKKFNAELYGWDELNKQSKQEDSSGGGGGGASGPSWSEVPVDDILKDWEGIDWFQKGYEWAEKFADALDKIPWDSIQEGARKAGTAIAQFLNGVFANLHLANSLGKTIAEAFNTAFDFALAFLRTFNFAQFGVWAGTLWNAFVEAFDFADVRETIKLAGNGLITALINFFETIESTCSTLGAGLAEIFNGIFADIDLQSLAYAFLLGLHDLNVAIQSFIDGVEWEKIADNYKTCINTFIKGMVFNKDGELVNVWAENGKVVGELIGKFVDTIYDLVTGLEWETLGANIALWLQNAISGIDLTKLFGAFVQAFNSLVSLVGGFVRTMDWMGLGKNLGESILNAIKMIDWANFGKTVGDLLIAALGLLAGFVQGVNWLELARSVIGGIGEALVNVDWLALLATLGALLVGVIEGAIELMIGAIAGCLDGLTAAFDALGSDSIAGFFKGISDALSSVGTWLKGHIVDPVVNGVKEMLGINSPSTVFAEIGDWLIQGLLQGISEAWHIITDFFGEVLGNLKQSITDKWNEIKTNVQEACNNIKQDVTEKWNNIKQTITDNANNIKQKVSENWNSIKQNTTEAYNNVKQIITSKFNEAKTNVTTALDNMKQSASTTWENLRSTAETKFENIRSTVHSKMTEAESFLKGLNWTAIGTDLVEGLLGGLKEKWEKVKSWASDAAKSLTDTVKGAFDIHSPSKIWAQIGTFLDEGLEQGLVSGERSMLSTVSGIASNINNRMQGADMNISADADVDRLDVITDKLAGIAAIIDHIAEALASMGGLEIPQIAVGTVVPPRTKIGANLSGDSGYTEEESYATNELVQLVRNIRDFLASGNGQRGGTVKVLIDGREVFQAVVDENNRTIARTGASPIRV